MRQFVEDFFPLFTTTSAKPNNLCSDWLHLPNSSQRPHGWFDFLCFEHYSLPSALAMACPNSSNSFVKPMNRLNNKRLCAHLAVLNNSAVAACSLQRRILPSSVGRQYSQVGMVACLMVSPYADILALFSLSLKNSLLPIRPLISAWTLACVGGKVVRAILRADMLVCLWAPTKFLSSLSSSTRLFR